MPIQPPSTPLETGLGQPVGFFPANGYGLHDMAGNVWEWCWDWYDANWHGQPAAASDDSRGPVLPLRAIVCCAEGVERPRERRAMLVAPWK